MTWTYDSAPDTTTAAGRRDAVRLLVGDTATTDQQVSDEEVAFALLEAGNNVYGAGAWVAQAIAGKYARRVSMSADGVSQQFAQRQKHYADLAARLEKRAVEGVVGGAPSGMFAGGTERGLTTDSPEVLFRVGMHDDPDAEYATTTDDLLL